VPSSPNIPDVDDTPPTLDDHPLSHRGGAEKHAGKIRVEHAPPLCLAELLRRRGEDEPGIVDKNVDSSELGDRTLDHPLDVVGERHVGRLHESAPPQTAHCEGSFLEVGL